MTSPAAPAPAPAVGFNSNDVVAFVGGEDAVAAQANGYLELVLSMALSKDTPRFRSVAVEGDTVFEQPRQLNFPPWEEMLRRVGATIVVVQFGQSESLKGHAGRAAFIDAYDKLLTRFAGTNAAMARRILLVSPTPFEPMEGLTFDPKARNKDINEYVSAIRELARRRRHVFVDLFTPLKQSKTRLTRDGIHLNTVGHWSAAGETARQLGFRPDETMQLDSRTGAVGPASAEALRQTILAKNRLWFDYWRPQNWAFLNGDRTEQASSRDHRNPRIRWFPSEMEQFLPLIAAREKEINAALAAARQP